MIIGLENNMETSVLLRVRCKSLRSGARKVWNKGLGFIGPGASNLMMPPKP